MAGSISIIVCTRNRAADLQQTLAAIAACAVPADLTAEVVVVDNASTDGTRAVILRAAGVAPARLAVRYVCAATPGKGYAYNAGIHASAGKVLLFTDDDVRPPADWIESMCRPIISDQADAVAGAIAAGPGRDLAGVFLPPAVSDAKPIDGQHILIGANMAFHRRVADACGGFDVALGPGALGLGDDTLFSFQAQRSGFRIVGNPDCAVEHHFDMDRCAPAIQCQTARHLAAASAYIDHHFHETRQRPSAIAALKSWFWLARLKARRLIGRQIPLSGWELHQHGQVAYFREMRRQCRLSPRHAAETLRSTAPRQELAAP